MVLRCSVKSSTFSTGSGKTLAYLLPIVIQAKLGALKGREGVKALLVGPTRELAAQIARVLARLVQGLGLRCCLLSAAGVTAGTDFTKVLLCFNAITLVKLSCKFLKSIIPIRDLKRWQR